MTFFPFFSFKSFFGGLVYVICNCFSSPYCTNVCKEEIFTHVHMWVQSHYRHYDFVYTTSLKDTERNCCSILSSFNDSCNLWKNRAYYLPPASIIWFSLLDKKKLASLAFKRSDSSAWYSWYRVPSSMFFWLQSLLSLATTRLDGRTRGVSDKIYYR